MLLTKAMGFIQTKSSMPCAPTVLCYAAYWQPTMGKNMLCVIELQYLASEWITKLMKVIMITAINGKIRILLENRITNFGICGWRWLLWGGDISAKIKKSVMRRGKIFFQAGTQWLKGMRFQTQPPDYPHTDSTISFNTVTACSFSDPKAFLPFLHQNINLQMFYLKLSLIGIPEADLVSLPGAPQMFVLDFGTGCDNECTVVAP